MQVYSNGSEEALLSDMREQELTGLMVAEEDHETLDTVTDEMSEMQLNHYHVLKTKSNNIKNVGGMTTIRHDDNGANPRLY